MGLRSLVALREAFRERSWKIWMELGWNGRGRMGYYFMVAWVFDENWVEQNYMTRRINDTDVSDFWGDMHSVCQQWDLHGD